MIKSKFSLVLLVSLLAWGFIPDIDKFKPINAAFAQDTSPNPTVEEASPETETSPDAEVTPVEEISPETETSPDAEVTPVEEISPETETSPDAEVTPVEEISPETETSPDAEATPVEEISPETETSPDAEEAEETGSGFPLWLLILIPLIGILGFFLLKQPEEETSTESSAEAESPTPSPTEAPSAETETETPPSPPVTLPTAESRIIATPRNHQEIYVYWEVPTERKTELREQGGQDLTLRLYDVTDIDIDQQDPHSTQSFTCVEDDPDLLIPIEQDGRDYMVELGYLTDTGDFLSIVRSLPVKVPEHPSEENTIDGEMGLIDAPPVVPPSTVTEEIPPSQSQITLTPQSCREVYVTWELSEAQKTQLKEQGGENMVLRIYDVTGIDIDQQSPHRTEEYDFVETTTDYHVPINQDNRDYMAELGYLTADNRFLSLVRSVHIHVPPCPPEEVEENDDDVMSIFEDEDLFSPTVTSDETTTETEENQ